MKVKKKNSVQTQREASNGPKKDANGNMNLSTTQTPFLVGPTINKKVVTDKDGDISLVFEDKDGNVTERKFDLISLDKKDNEELKNKKTAKSRPTVAERKTSVKKAGTFSVEKNAPIKSLKSNKREWILNNANSNVIVTRAEKTILENKIKNVAGCVVIQDYVHKDVFSKEDIETPEFKNLVRKGILEFASSAQLCDMLRNKVSTLMEGGKDWDSIFARKIHTLTEDEIISILKKSIIKRIETIDTGTLNRINWLLAQSIKERGQLKLRVEEEKCQQTSNEDQEKKYSDLYKKFEEDQDIKDLLSSSERIDIDSKDCPEKTTFDKYSNELSLNNDDNISIIQNNIKIIKEKKENVCIEEKKSSSIYVDPDIENLVNNGLEALKKILIKALISLSK